jgi:hypothetical protein
MLGWRKRYWAWSSRDPKPSNVEALDPSVNPFAVFLLPSSARVPLGLDLGRNTLRLQAMRAYLYT